MAKKDRMVASQQLGYVADFCPLCRDIKRFQLVGASEVAKGEKFTGGRFNFHHYLATCPTCDTLYQVELARYADISEKPLALDALITKTFPTIRQVYADRLLLEDLLKASPKSIHGETRAKLLWEPFVLLSYMTEKNVWGHPRDIGVLISYVVVFLIWLSMIPLHDKLVASGNGVVFRFLTIPLILPVFWQMVEARKRFVRNKIAPKIAQSLQPLKPSIKEYDDILTQLRQRKHQFGLYLKASDFFPRK
jgi:hypothetical protein